MGTQAWELRLSWRLPQSPGMSFTPGARAHGRLRPENDEDFTGGMNGMGMLIEPLRFYMASYGRSNFAACSDSAPHCRVTRWRARVKPLPGGPRTVGGAGCRCVVPPEDAVREGRRAALHWGPRPSCPQPCYDARANAAEASQHDRAREGPLEGVVPP